MSALQINDLEFRINELKEFNQGEADKDADNILLLSETLQDLFYNSLEVDKVQNLTYQLTALGQVDLKNALIVWQEEQLNIIIR